MNGRVADAEHHRRRRAKAHAVRRSHDREPLVGRAFGGDALANLVVENLSAAARHAVESSRLQARHDLFVCELRSPWAPEIMNMFGSNRMGTTSVLSHRPETHAWRMASNRRLGQVTGCSPPVPDIPPA